MSSVTGASAVTGIPHPHPPGIMSILASLFQVPHPEPTNAVTRAEKASPQSLPSALPQGTVC